MPDPSTDYMYLAVRPCGCVAGFVMDDTADPKWTAKEVAAFLRKGCQIERMTCEAWREDKRPMRCVEHPRQQKLTEVANA